MAIIKRYEFFHHDEGCGHLHRTYEAAERCGAEWVRGARNYRYSFEEVASQVKIVTLATTAGKKF